MKRWALVVVALYALILVVLKVAVPTHVAARSRDYCCAGVMTFIGLTLGVSVMLFSYGPAAVFLYVGRWRRLHPEPAATPGQMA